MHSIGVTVINCSTQNERMTPIVIALVPTIVGAGERQRYDSCFSLGVIRLPAIMVGLQDNGHQGVLLFGNNHVLPTWHVC